MFMKRCPQCGENSYSSTGDGRWICPNCGTDISHINAEMPPFEGKVEKPQKRGLRAWISKLKD